MKYDIKCDCCGKFIAWNKIGSQLFVPESDVSYEELRYRCKECTDQNGHPLPFQHGMVAEICCTTYK